MGILFLIQIWSDASLCYTNCGVLACHTALFTFWQWILPLTSMQVAKIGCLFFLFVCFSGEAKFLISHILHYSGLCEILQCIHCARGFAAFIDFFLFYNNVVKIDFNYYSIHVYQENLIQLLSIHHSFSMCSTCVWHH